MYNRYLFYGSRALFLLQRSRCMMLRLYVQRQSNARASVAHSRDGIEACAWPDGGNSGRSGAPAAEGTASSAGRRSSVQANGGNAVPRDGGSADRAGGGRRRVRAQKGRADGAGGGGARQAGPGIAQQVGCRIVAGKGARPRGQRAESAAHSHHGTRLSAGRQMAPTARPVPRVRGGRAGQRHRRRRRPVVDRRTLAAAATPADVRRAAAARAVRTPFLRGRRQGELAVPPRVVADHAVVAHAHARLSEGIHRRGPSAAVGRPTVLGRARRRRAGPGAGQAARHAGAVRADRGTRAQTVGVFGQRGRSERRVADSDRGGR